jgi:hypothetical protein
MQLSVENAAIPYGLHAGVMCLNVPWEDINEHNAKSLANLAHRGIRHGQRLVRVTGDVPWGTVAVDRILLEFMDDPRLEGAELWCSRDCKEEAWPTPELWTVLDTSPCFDAQPLQELTRRLGALPLMPRPTEVVVFEPAIKALTEGLLNEVFSRLDPVHAWIYTSDPDAYERAVKVASRAVTGWGVRWNHG